MNMKLPERHQSYIRGKMRKFYLLPIIYYPVSKKLRFRWPLRTNISVHWTHYMLTNIKTFMFLPFLVMHNYYYFRRSGFIYEGIDYDEIYG